MNEKYGQILVKRIESFMKKRGLTQYQVAILSGIRHSTLSDIMSGKTSNPRIHNLHKIALGFSMTLAEFLDFEKLNNFSFDE